MFNLFKKNISPIGLDLSDGSVEAVQLKNNGQAIEIAASSRIDLPDGLIKRGKINDLEKTAALIDNLLKNPTTGKFQNNTLIMNLPEERILTHVFKFSPPVKENIDQKIIAQITALVPISMDNTSLTWQITHQDIIDQIVFTAAIPREFVSSRKSLAEKLKLDLTHLEMESASLVRSIMNKNVVQEPVLLIDIGGQTSFIAINDENGIYSTYNLAIGGKSFSLNLAEALKISLDEAEQKKRTVGFNLEAKEPAVASMLQSSIQPLIDETFKTIHFYESATKKKLKKVFLTGGSSLIPGIDRYLAQLLQLEVNLGQVWISNQPQFSQDTSALFPIAVGLALRGLIEKDPGLNFLT